MSMTIQEALHQIRLQREFQKPFSELIDAYTMAIVALKEKAERENPKPLTIEELRQMDGEPVWVKELSELIDQTGWALVEVADRGTYKGVPYVKCHICTWDVSFRGLHCYRYKPKEV